MPHLDDASFVQTLPDGGKLRIFHDCWEIYYYFSGPDMRYNGTSVRFRDHEVPKAIEHYRSAYEKFKESKRVTPAEAELKIGYSMDLTIRVGGSGEGVCLGSYHDPVHTDDGLNVKLESFSMAIERAPKIQELLRELCL